MNCRYSHVHLIGIGGIHVSGIAKLLLAQGVSVSGSDLAENEQVKELRGRGVEIKIGHAPTNIPAEAQVIVFSSAAAPSNPERLEGVRRGLPEFNSHQFLGVLGEGMKQIVIAGTHGKSTTTAMMALVAKETGLAPTVVVGTQVPQLEQGNVEVGSSEWLIVEGDEFDHHFLSYTPTVLVINNIEGDHFDIYPTIEAMIEAYRQLLTRVIDGGTIIANMDDAHVRTLIEAEREKLYARHIKIKTVGTSTDVNILIGSRRVTSGLQVIHVSSTELRENIDVTLTIPGAMNAMNAVMCYAVSEVLNLSQEKTLAALAGFKGIWRRLEKIVEREGIVVFSDYGHHPTAVTKTLEAVKEFYPDRRLVLCFQPHHRNRTKHLFLEFVPSFDLAHELILVEIYDVAGRDQSEDESISSQDLCDAIRHHDADRGVKRGVQFAKDAKTAKQLLKELKQSGDVVVVMGAGSIYTIASEII
jgi:UDP-N-acetylmuramate--alanine ligase